MTARRALSPTASALARLPLPSRLRPIPLSGLRALPPRSSLPSPPARARRAPRFLPAFPLFPSLPVVPSCPPPLTPRAALAVPARSLCERRRSRQRPPAAQGSPEARPASEPRGARPCSRGLYLSAPLRFCNAVRPVSSLPLPPIAAVSLYAYNNRAFPFSVSFFCFFFFIFSLVISG